MFSYDNHHVSLYWLFDMGSLFIQREYCNAASVVKVEGGGNSFMSWHFVASSIPILYVTRFFPANKNVCIYFFRSLCSLCTLITHPNNNNPKRFKIIVDMIEHKNVSICNNFCITFSLLNCSTIIRCYACSFYFDNMLGTFDKL